MIPLVTCTFNVIRVESVGFKADSRHTKLIGVRGGRNYCCEGSQIQCIVIQF
jgi:hypothetical protein